MAEAIPTMFWAMKLIGELFSLRVIGWIATLKIHMAVPHSVTAFGDIIFKEVMKLKWGR